MHDNARFIYASDQQAADAVQAGFIALAYKDDPPESWFTEFHKEGETSVRILIKNDQKFWMIADADPTVFDALLQPYIDQGLMSQQDLDTIHDRVRIFCGTGVGIYLYNMLPPIIRGMSWSYQEMIDNGWISENAE